MNISQTSYQTGFFQEDHHFSPDTDVAVLCWYRFSQLSIQEFGSTQVLEETEGSFPLHKAVEKVGQDVCSLLPAIHALSGCDSTSSLNVTA